MFWNKGEAFMKEICSHQLDIKVTGLIGMPKEHSKKKFSKHELEADPLIESRFTTLEISFFSDRATIGEDSDDELDILTWVKKH